MPSGRQVGGPGRAPPGVQHQPRRGLRGAGRWKQEPHRPPHRRGTRCARSGGGRRGTRTGAPGRRAGGRGRGGWARGAQAPGGGTHTPRRKSPGGTASLPSEIRVGSPAPWLSGGSSAAVGCDSRPTPNRCPPPSPPDSPAGGRTHRRSFVPPKHPESRAPPLPGPRPWPDPPPSPGGGGPPACCFAYANEARGRRGRPRVVPPVGPLGPGRRSRCLLSRSLFLCAAFRGIKADTVVTRSPAGQRSDFTIPITMISNDVYLAGSDGRELYKRAPLPSPLPGGPRARGALASAPAGGRCAAPGHRARRPPRRRALRAGRRRWGGGVLRPPAPGSLRTPLRCWRPRRD